MVAFKFTAANRHFMLRAEIPPLGFAKCRAEQGVQNACHVGQSCRVLRLASVRRLNNRRGTSQSGTRCVKFQRRFILKTKAEDHWPIKQFAIHGEYKEKIE